MATSGDVSPKSSTQKAIIGMAVAAVTKQLIRQKAATKKEKPRLLMASPSGWARDFFSNSIGIKANLSNRRIKAR